MKRIVALLLAALIAFTLCSCASKANTEPSPSTAQNTVTDSPSPEVSVSPNTLPSAEQGADKSVGFITDQVDHFSRDPYKVVFLYGLGVPVCANVFSVLETLGKKMNFEVLSFCADGDMAKYVDIIETQINTGVDGFLFSGQADLLQRQYELCTEAKVPYVDMLSGYRDAQGHTLAPVVAVDGYRSGASIVDWLLNNYSKYFKEVELSSIGFIVLRFSAAEEFNNRADGAVDEYLKLHPELEKNLYQEDLIDLGFSADAGYNKAAAVMAAHSELKYWFLFGVAEDFALGAARAVESLNKADSALVVSTGNDFNFELWESADNTSCWVATVPIYKTELAVPMAAGLVALMDGRATFDTLWADMKKPGDTAAQYNIPTDVVERGTHKDYITKADAVLDLLN